MSKRALRIAPLLALLACATLAPYRPGQVRTDRRIIHSHPDLDMFKECSRSTVSMVTGVFPLSAAEAAAFEARLPAFLSQSVRHPPHALDRYFFEYAGVLSGGRRVLYARATPDWLLDDRTTPDNIHGMVVCDGGPDFWSIVFDLEMLVFEDPTFNGHA